MATDDGHKRTLSEEAAALIELGSDRPDEVNASLKTLLNNITISPHDGPAEEALQLLGTAVGGQSEWSWFCTES